MFDASDLRTCSRSSSRPPYGMPRTFTIEQANRMLPLVRRIVIDIVEHHARWKECVKAFEVLTLASSAEAPSQVAEEAEVQAQQLAKDIQGFLNELRALGLELKGFDQGLVDFPGELDNRPVYWCWKLGEPRVSFWHEVDAGFAGRRPLEATAHT